jgi:HPr kinase/phosphorylase
MSAGLPASAGIHATGVIYGESGVLVLGRSGSGKSALALALMDRARIGRNFSALIGDDRIWTRSAAGRLIASGSDRTAGLVERRGVGLLAAPSEPAAVIDLIVELERPERGLARIPDEPDIAIVEGIGLPRLRLDSRRSAGDNAVVVAERLERLAAFGAERKAISLEHCAAVHKNSQLAGAREAVVGRHMGC